MTEQIQGKIPFTDLTQVTFECDCGAEIILDISTHAKIATKCSGCETELQGRFADVFGKLREWHKCLEDSDHTN